MTTDCRVQNNQSNETLGSEQKELQGKKRRLEELVNVCQHQLAHQS